MSTPYGLIYALSCAGKHPAAIPTTPPLQLQPTDAFYIASMPGPVHPAAATVCGSSEACLAALPAERPVISLDFSRESWVIIHVPPQHNVNSVVSHALPSRAVRENGDARSRAGLQVSEDRRYAPVDLDIMSRSGGLHVVDSCRLGV